MILKLLITRGNITLIPKEATEEKYNLKFENTENKKKENQKNIKMKMTNTTTTRGHNENKADFNEFPGNAGSILPKQPWPVVGHVLVSGS